MHTTASAGTDRPVGAGAAWRDGRCAHPEAPVAWLQAVLQAQLKGERHVLPRGQSHRATLQEGAWSCHHGAKHLRQAEGPVGDACSPEEDSVSAATTFVRVAPRAQHDRSCNATHLETLDDDQGGLHSEGVEDMRVGRQPVHCCWQANSRQTAG